MAYQSMHQLLHGPDHFNGSPSVWNQGTHQASAEGRFSTLKFRQACHRTIALPLSGASAASPVAPAGRERAQVAVATFDSTIHFYSLRPSQSQPHMLVVPDVADPYAPQSASLICNAKESRVLVSPRTFICLRPLGYVNPEGFLTVTLFCPHPPATSNYVMNHTRKDGSLERLRIGHMG